MTDIVKDSINQVIEQLTINQLYSIVEVIDNKVFITDECATADDKLLLSKMMIKYGSKKIVNRLQQEAG